MYKSSLLVCPSLDLTWFWDGVMKFNGIANPAGVKVENQIPIIKSELQEILDSKNETEFMDGIIDGLVTLIPLVPRDMFCIYGDNQNIRYHDLLSQVSDYINEDDFKSWDHEFMLDTLLHVLLQDSEYETNVLSILESNMSKFIPVEFYEHKYFDEVCKSYPDVHVVVEERDYNGEKFMVFFNADTGKILKGHSLFIEPTLNVG